MSKLVLTLVLFCFLALQNVQAATNCTATLASSSSLPTDVSECCYKGIYNASSEARSAPAFPTCFNCTLSNLATAPYLSNICLIANCPRIIASNITTHELYTVCLTFNPSTSDSSSSDMTTRVIIIITILGAFVVFLAVMLVLSRYMQMKKDLKSNTFKDARNRLSANAGERIAIPTV